jgi:hypothetical protein
MQACTQIRNKFLIAASFETGHDFSRADKANQINRTLAPEGSFMGDSHQISTFSAACLALLHSVRPWTPFQYPSTPRRKIET